ncbi:zinc finger protein 708-like [Ochlerotatus camptorhynchus]|uniref:zinc finger protein 708-like n=1 Tax=Ochlerotatus camptorhynchus TaxID=644619 RepID=UPI0031D24598
MDLEPQICRLCLELVDPRSVFVLNHDEKIIESILQITTIEVIVDPTRRVFMCDQCHTMLDQFIQFRTACLQNDDTYRKMYAKLTVSSELVKLEPNDPEAVLVQCKLEDESQSSEPESGAMVKQLEPEVDILEQEQVLIEQEKPRKPRKKYKKKVKVSGTQKVQCQTCGAFVTQRHLPKHQLIHDQDRPMFSCTQCPKKYTEHRKLRQHITIVHEGHVEHTCDRCGKTFYRSATLKQHFLAEHTDIKRYECKICGEKFARASNRAYHYKMNHTTVRPYSCEYCLKTFKRSCDYRIHTRTHTGEKPFKCDLCDKRFCKSYNLVIHKKSHKNADMRRDAKMLTMEGTSEDLDCNV